MNVIRKGASAAVAVCAALTLLAAPTAAQEGVDGLKEGQEGFPGPGAANSVHVIPGAAFTTDGSEAAGSYVFWFLNGAIEGAGAAGGGCVTAPVHVPDDGNAYQFWGSLYDNDPADSVWLDLYRVGTYTGVTDVMASVTTSSDGTAPQSIGDYSIVNGDLGYPNYSYYVTTCLGTANQKVYSARLWYHPEGIFDDGFGTANTSRWHGTVY